ncbi:hypothetical protein O0L34_g2463 [Tuta absoluta]|nr:hypothetical protein O0L34_g2463 [Tuta absoluta]
MTPSSKFKFVVLLEGVPLHLGCICALCLQGGAPCSAGVGSVGVLAPIDRDAPSCAPAAAVWRTRVHRAMIAVIALHRRADRTAPPPPPPRRERQRQPAHAAGPSVTSPPTHSEHPFQNNDFLYFKLRLQDSADIKFYALFSTN